MSATVGLGASKISLPVASANLLFGVLPVQTTTVSVGSENAVVRATRFGGLKLLEDHHHHDTWPLAGGQADITEFTDFLSSQAGPRRPELRATRVGKSPEWCGPADNLFVGSGAVNDCHEI